MNEKVDYDFVYMLTCFCAKFLSEEKSDDKSNVWSIT